MLCFDIRRYVWPYATLVVHHAARASTVHRASNRIDGLFQRVWCCQGTKPRQRSNESTAVKARRYSSCPTVFVLP